MLTLWVSDDNVTYDKTVYTVTITVTDDLKGSLVAKVEYSTEDGAAPVFRNSYTPDAIEVTIEAAKKLVGRDLKEGEFTFQLLDASGKAVATAKNTADGKIIFSGIVLTEGKYTFTVSEVKGGDRTIVYDTNSFTVTVEVTYSGDELVAKITYPTGGVVHHHGMGKQRVGYAQQEHGTSYSLMKDLKRVFDPNNIMNRGVLITEE